MEWISVKDRLPNMEDCGEDFLCSIKTCTHFQEYELAEWFNPMNEDEVATEKHEMPHFSIKASFVNQQLLSREVTHWMPLLTHPLIKLK